MCGVLGGVFMGRGVEKLNERKRMVSLDNDFVYL